MTLKTDPSRFSITVFQADSVALIVRGKGCSPGEAAHLLQRFMADPASCSGLLSLIRDAWHREADGREAMKIAAIHEELTGWTALASGARPDRVSTERADHGDFRGSARACLRARSRGGLERA